MTVPTPQADSAPATQKIPHCPKCGHADQVDVTFDIDLGRCSRCDFEDVKRAFPLIAPRPSAAERHDPLERREDGEPYFALMGRDWRSPPHIQMYADTREGKWRHAHEILDAMERAAGGHPPVTPKDKEQAWSARAKAGEMIDWFRDHRAAGEPINRVNVQAATEVVETLIRTDYTNLTIDDAGAFADAKQLDDIRRAHPDPEPDEAS